MSASLDVESDWNFRIVDKRLVVAKTVNESARKIVALDVLTNLVFTVQVPENVDMQSLAVNHEYLFNLKVYTSKFVGEVDKEFVSFFEALDIDQSIEDFIKAYWVYPGKIRFELIETEEP